MMMLWYYDTSWNFYSKKNIFFIFTNAHPQRWPTLPTYLGNICSLSLNKNKRIDPFNLPMDPLLNAFGLEWKSTRLLRDEEEFHCL